MWLLFVRGVRHRWWELAAAALVVGLVVAALLAQRAITGSAERSVHDLAHRLGRNMLVVPSETDLASFYGHRYGPGSLPDTTPATLRASPLAEHVRSIEARLYGRGTVAGVDAIVVGQDLAWPALPGRQPAVLGAELARRAGLGRGAVFELGGVPLEVVDVATSPPDGLDTAVFLPLAAAQRALGRPGQLSALRLGGCWCRIDVASLGRQVEQLLPGARAVTVAGMLEAQKGSVAVMGRYGAVLDAAGLALIAAVVGALTASRLRRRIREFGLLVAVGASPARVAGLWVLEAAVVGGAGAVLGWLAAAPLARQAGAQLLGASLELVAPPLAPYLLLAAGVCALVALVPAAWAARRDPTVALRET